MNARTISLLLVAVMLNAMPLFAGGEKEAESSLVTSTKTEKADFVIGNGTGDIITEIEIRPSQKKYKGNKNVCDLQGLSVPDQAVFGISLPPQMQGMDSFDMVVKYGKSTAKTKKSFTLVQGSTDTPMVVLSIKGKDPTIPLIAGGAGAGGTAAGIGITAAALKAGTAWAIALTNSGAIGAGALAGTLAWIGSIVGGGMVAGIAIVAAAPVVVGGGIFAAVMLLSAKTLEVTPISFIAQ